MNDIKWRTTTKFYGSTSGGGQAANMEANTSAFHEQFGGSHMGTQVPVFSAQPTPPHDPLIEQARPSVADQMVDSLFGNLPTGLHGASQHDYTPGDGGNM